MLLTTYFGLPTGEILEKWLPAGNDRDTMLIFSHRDKELMPKLSKRKEYMAHDVRFVRLGNEVSISQTLSVKPSSLYA